MSLGCTSTTHNKSLQLSPKLRCGSVNADRQFHNVRVDAAGQLNSMLCLLWAPLITNSITFAFARSMQIQCVYAAAIEFDGVREGAL